MALLANPFYKNDLIRKYIALFGKLFDGITIERTDSSGVRIQTMQIPIAYAPRDAYLVRLGVDPNLDRQPAVQLPVMSFELTALIYNGERKIQSTRRFSRQSTSDENKAFSTFMPVPYDFTFTMNVISRNFDDSLSIVEQILPFFRPDLTVAMNTMPGLELVQDIPIILQDITLEDTWEGNFEDRRAIIWTLTFLMKGYLFGPTSVQGYIKKAIIDHNIYGFGNTELTDFVSRITVQPGLTAANTPTSNLELSVPLSQIEKDDNWDFITTKEDG